MRIAPLSSNGKLFLVPQMALLLPEAAAYLKGNVANAGVSMAVIEALEAICKEYEGTEAVIRAGTGTTTDPCTSCAMETCSTRHLSRQEGELSDLAAVQMQTLLSYRHMHTMQALLPYYLISDFVCCSDTLTVAVLAYSGGTDVLQEAVDHGWLMDVLARELAASLLVGLKIQQGHLD